MAVVYSAAEISGVERELLRYVAGDKFFEFANAEDSTTEELVARALVIARVLRANDRIKSTGIEE